MGIEKKRSTPMGWARKRALGRNSASSRMRTVLISVWLTSWKEPLVEKWANQGLSKADIAILYTTSAALFPTSSAAMKGFGWAI